MSEPYVPPAYNNSVSDQNNEDVLNQSQPSSEASSNPAINADSISLQPTFGGGDRSENQVALEQQSNETGETFHAIRDETEDRSDLKSDDFYITDKSHLDDSSYLLTHPKSTKDLFGCSHLLVVPLFFTMAFFTYFDRGTLSASLDNIQTQLLDDSSFKSGALASAYLFGYCLSCPIFALLGSYYPPIRMSAMGMFVWSIGCALTGILSDFGLLILARLLTGIGEASFLSFSSTIIDTIVPSESRGRWLGFFYMAIPLGYAFGDGIGGVVADLHIYTVDNNNESWRLTFIIEFIAMLPLVLMMACMKSPPNILVIKEIKHGNENVSLQQPQDLTDDPWNVKLIRIVTNKTWLASTAGYATQTFVTGTFAVEAITYLQKVYNQSSGTAGTMIGVITFTTGVFGSIFGGLVLDKLKGREQILHDSRMNLNINDDNNNNNNNNENVVSVSNDSESTDYIYVGPAFTLLTMLSLAAFPAALLIFIFHDIYLFYALLGFAEFFIFASQGPVNNAVLWCSLYKDRPLAAALNTLAIHLFGDALAPLLIGWLVDLKEKNGSSESDAYNFALSIASWWLGLSVIAFFLGRYTLDGLKKRMISYQKLEQN